jgi:serine/threonine protein kinase
MHAYEIFHDAGHMYCVYELLSGGDLSSLREHAEGAGVPLTEDYWRLIFRQCLLGLDSLHQHSIMHCDIKEPNVMVKNTDFSRPAVCIIDVGLAAACAGAGVSGGTPGYRPPETCTTDIWFPKGDVFSLGVVFYQLMANQVPGKPGMGVFQEGAKTIEDCNEFCEFRPLPIERIEGIYPGIKEARPNQREDNGWLWNMCEKERSIRHVPKFILEGPWFQREASPVVPAEIPTTLIVTDDMPATTLIVSNDMPANPGYITSVQSGQSQASALTVNQVDIDGSWSKGDIQGQRLIWHDGHVDAIQKIGSTAFTVKLPEGEQTAELMADGKLHWSDGDVWARKEYCGLDGKWNKATIEGFEIVWPAGQRDALLTKTEDMLQVQIQGGFYQAELRTDGCLYWSDGDVWKRGVSV